MRPIRFAISCCAVLTLFAMSLPNSASAQAGETLDTRIGKLSFTHDFANGYPVDATQKLLFDKTWVLPDLEKTK